MTTQSKHTPIERWLSSASSVELLEGADYLEKDAAYLREQEAKYRKTPGQHWIADKVAKAAAHSEHYAQAAIAKARGEV